MDFIIRFLKKTTLPSYNTYLSQRLQSFASIHTQSCDSMLTNTSRERFELFPFRSPLLGESIRFAFPHYVLISYPIMQRENVKRNCFFFSSGYWDVSLHQVPSLQLCIDCKVMRYESQQVSLFGYLRIKGCLPPPRSFSQATTSFIGTFCQAILRILLLVCSTTTLI